MKILVCTLAINDWYRDIVKYSIRNFEYYCNMHDYEFIIQTENSLDTVFDNTRSPCWYKIKLIQKILKEAKFSFFSTDKASFLQIATKFFSWVFEGLHVIPSSLSCLIIFLGFLRSTTLALMINICFK